MLLPKKHLLALISLASLLQAADDYRPGSRVDDGTPPTERTFLEDKRELYAACSSCDAVRAFELLARTQNRLTEDEQAEITESTIAECHATTAAEILYRAGQHRFNFNRFRRIPPLFSASVLAAKSCNLSLVRALIAQQANPHMPFSLNGLITSTYATFEILAKQNDCGPCTRDVFDLFRKPENDYKFLEENANDQRETESEPKPMPAPQQEPANNRNQDQSNSASQQSSSESSASESASSGSSSDSGSGGNGWGAWLKSVWKHL